MKVHLPYQIWKPTAPRCDFIGECDLQPDQNWFRNDPSNDWINVSGPDGRIRQFRVQRFFLPQTQAYSEPFVTLFDAADANLLPGFKRHEHNY